MIKVVSAEKAPAAIGPYSHGMLINDSLFFSSGQIPIDPATGNLVDGNITEQTHAACKNMSAVLEAAGLNFENVIKTTCFLSDMDNFAAFNEVYGQYFTSKPARSCVAVKTLPKNALVEIEVIASK